MSTTPPSNGKNGVVTKVIDRLLSYADRPWRALFLIILIVLIGFGWAAWHERQTLLKLLEQRHEKLSTDLGPIITEVFYKSTADAVSIWSINLGSSTVQFIVGRRRDLSPWELTPTVLRAFTEQSDPIITAKLLQGQAACFEPSGMKFLIAQSLANDGILAACIVPEPPSRTAPLIGMVILGWRTKPPEAISEAAVASVLRLTDNIVVH